MDNGSGLLGTLKEAEGPREHEQGDEKLRAERVPPVNLLQPSQQIVKAAFGDLAAGRTLLGIPGSRVLAAQTGEVEAMQAGLVALLAHLSLADHAKLGLLRGLAALQLHAEQLGGAEAAQDEPEGQQH